MSETQRTLAAAATIGNKHVNQDAFAVARNEEAGLVAILVADGVGSHFGAEVASAMVVANLRKALEQTVSPCEIDIPSLFLDARTHLERHVKQHAGDLPADLDWQNAFGTTLLCGVERSDHIILGYVGNGGIFHLRGNFNCFPPSQLLPWTAVNYLNPHSFSQDGKNILYDVVSVNPEHEMTPTVLSLRKSGDRFGDIVMICSDGLYSYDQVPIGKDDQDHIWISGEQSVTLFFQHLNRFFTGEEYTDQALQAALEGYLAEIKARGLVTDDCTLGVMVTGAALRFQRSLRGMPLGEVWR
jgi:serine/threonine protein phosphatase PrpC